MIYTLTQATKEHSADRLQDALIAAGLPPAAVTYTGEETTFVFPDSTAEEDIQAVVDGYSFGEPPAQPDVSPFRAVTVTIDLTQGNPAVNAVFPPEFIVFMVLGARPSTDLTTVNSGGGIKLRVAGGDDDSTFVNDFDVAAVNYGEQGVWRMFSIGEGYASSVQFVPPYVQITGTATGPATMDLIFMALATPAAGGGSGIPLPVGLALPA